MCDDHVVVFTASWLWGSWFLRYPKHVVIITLRFSSSYRISSLFLTLELAKILWWHPGKDDMMQSILAISFWVDTLSIGLMQRFYFTFIPSLSFPLILTNIWVLKKYHILILRSGNYHGQTWIVHYSLEWYPCIFRVMFSLSYLILASTLIYLCSLTLLCHLPPLQPNLLLLLQLISSLPSYHIFSPGIHMIPSPFGTDISFTMAASICWG